MAREGAWGSRRCAKMSEPITLEATTAFPNGFSCASHISSSQVLSLKRRQSILYVTSEIADYVKAGGLGEVSAALPRALRRHYDVRILVPGYRQLLSKIGTVEEIGHLPAAFGIPACGLGRATTQDGLTVYVLLCPELYERDGTPYGDDRGVDWSDNDVRFARLGLAAADIACGSGDSLWRADLLHLNDWPSGLAAAYLEWRGRPMPTIMTVHNLAYQGLFDRDRLQNLGVPDAAFQINGVEFHGKLSFLKAGLFYASHITTVSSTYAEEITRPEFGCGLDGPPQNACWGRAARRDREWHR
jgi:starch synthase